MFFRDLLFDLVLFILLWHSVHLGYSQTDSVSISAFPTTTPCYGDIVILTCHHPQLASDPGQEYSPRPHWKKNGIPFNPLRESDIYIMENTSGDSKYTNLTINITLSHFGNKVVTFSCEILPRYRTVQRNNTVSEEVTINPIEPPKTDIIVCFTAKNLSWEHSEWQLHCYGLHYNVSWENKDDSSDIGWNTTTDKFYDISQLQRRNNYTISVKSMVGNVSGEQDSINIESGAPFVHCVDIPCYNSSFLMTCNTSRYTENVVISNWLHGDEIISNCSYTKDSHYVIDDCSVLIIRNVSPNTAGEYHCNVRDGNQRILQGDSNIVDPPEIPLKPEVNYTMEGDQIFLNWTHNAACFNYTFNFSIEWEIVEDSSFQGNITSELQYIIPGIQARTYNVCIQAVNDEYALNGSLSCLMIYLAGGSDSWKQELLALLVIPLVIAIVIVIVIIVAVGKRTRKRGCCSTARTNPYKQELQKPQAFQIETERTSYDQELTEEPHAIRRKPAKTANPYKQEPKKPLKRMASDV